MKVGTLLAVAVVGHTSWRQQFLLNHVIMRRWGLIRTLVENTLWLVKNLQKLHNLYPIGSPQNSSKYLLVSAGAHIASKSSLEPKMGVFSE